jgi:hypothetical protein
MGYNIEISLNLIKIQNSSEIKQNINDLAMEYNCNNFYIMDDTDIYSKIKRIHSIMVVNFLENELNNCIRFIREMKKQKNCFIECVYDDNVYKLIHASSYYLKCINKQKSIDYKKCIKECNFNENEIKLLNLFH